MTNTYLIIDGDEYQMPDLYNSVDHLLDQCMDWLEKGRPSRLQLRGGVTVLIHWGNVVCVSAHNG